MDPEAAKYDTDKAGNHHVFQPVDLEKELYAAVKADEIRGHPGEFQQLQNLQHLEDPEGFEKGIEGNDRDQVQNIPEEKVFLTLRQQQPDPVVGYEQNGNNRIHILLKRCVAYKDITDG